ncbi:MAG TPA: cysteine synthase A [Candidatus Scatomonas merdigallinarum]|nr:cysteine synthase A [Candidatus Scatomonas merdigallinarum]
MTRIYQSAEEITGNTPLLRAGKLERRYSLNARLLLKLEYLNPTGSVKDRAALYMIRDAEQAGLLQPGGVIVEPTSGNTGIGLASLAASRGYRLILTMPETMSVERRNILKAYGAEIVLTEGSRGMSGAIEKAEEIVKSTPGAFLPGQFDNPSNARAHYETTGPEIWRDTQGQVDIFVAGVGTGGTLTGTGRYLKEQNPRIRVVAVEPSASPVLSEGKGGPHKIQGIGAGFVPSVLDQAVYDEVFPVDNEVCFTMAKELAHLEGILTGISSGAALYAAVEIAKRPENEGKTLAVLLPDSGDRYYSTPLFG